MAEQAHRPGQGQLRRIGQIGRQIGKIRHGSGIRQIEQVRKDLQKRRKHIVRIGKRIQFVIRWMDRLRNLLWNMRIRNLMSS